MAPKRVTPQPSPNATRKNIPPQVVSSIPQRPIVSAGILGNLQSARSSDILALQRQVGNSAVRLLLGQGSSGSQQGVVQRNGPEEQTLPRHRRPAPLPPPRQKPPIVHPEADQQNESENAPTLNDRPNTQTEFDNTANVNDGPDNQTETENQPVTNDAPGAQTEQNDHPNGRHAPDGRAKPPVPPSGTQPEPKKVEDGKNNSFLKKALAFGKKGLKNLKNLGPRFFGRLGSQETENKATENEYVDNLSPEEKLQHSQKTKGSHDAIEPDYKNPDPKIAGQKPTRYVVTLAVVQEDLNWYRDIKAVSNAFIERALKPTKWIGDLTRLKNNPPKDTKTAILHGPARQVLSDRENEKLTRKNEKNKQEFPDNEQDKESSEEGQNKNKPSKREENVLDEKDYKNKLPIVTKFIDDLQENVGHAWVRLSAYVGNKLRTLYSFGMWPQKVFLPGGGETGGFAGMTQAGPGEIRHPDMEHEKDSNKLYYDHPTTAKKFGHALDKAAARYASPPAYVLMGYNCTAFAREVFQAAGGSFPGVGLILPGMAFTPASLYDAIIKLWNKGNKNAHIADLLPKNVLKEMSKQRKERAEESQGEVNAKYKEMRQRKPSLISPKIPVPLMAGQKVQYGDVQPDQLNQTWSISANVEVTEIEDEAFIERWQAVPVVYQGAVRFIKRDDFDKAADKLKAYHYEGNLPDEKSLSSRPDRTYTPAQAGLLIARFTENGWLLVIDNFSNEMYCVNPDQYVRMTGDPLGICSPQNEKAPKEPANEPPQPPTPNESESFQPGLYRLDGEQAQFAVMKKDSEELLLYLERDTVVDVLGNDPTSEYRVEIRFSHDGQKQEGRIQKGILSQAQPVEEELEKAPEEETQADEPAGTRESLVAYTVNDNGQHISTITLEDPNEIEKDFIHWGDSDESYSRFDHVTLGSMSAPTKNLKAFLGIS